MTKGELIKLLQTNGHNDDTVYMGYERLIMDLHQEAIVKVIPGKNKIVLATKDYT